MDENNTNVIDDDENLLLDLEDMPTEEESNVEVEEKPASETETKPQETEDEAQKFLEYLNKKGIKYNGENVELKNMDEVVNNIEKGMNYDKLKSRQDRDDDEVMNYITEKANSFGITTKEYIQRVKNYEEEQKKAKVEEFKQSLIDRGVEPDAAKEVAEVKAYMEQLKAERAEFEKEKQAALAEKKKNEEYSEFMKTYPDVKAEDIPKEVFQDAEKIGLTNAYARYENKILREKNKILEQNAKNASSSPVLPTSEGSSVNQGSKDAFLEGFDSE